MIRVGSLSTSGVKTILNDFHSKVEVTSGFYVRSSGGDPPPPTINGQFGSQQTSPPYIRNNNTIFVDPYGLPNLPVTIGSFYFGIFNNGGLFDLSWANAYDGTCKSLLPEGLLEESFYTETTDQLYVRVNTKTRPYRLFDASSGPNRLFVLVGPLSISKVVPAGLNFILAELIGISSAKFSSSIAGTTAFLSKEEAPIDQTEMGIDIGLTLFSELPISGGTYTDVSDFRTLILQ